MLLGRILRSIGIEEHAAAADGDRDCSTDFSAAKPRLLVLLPDDCRVEPCVSADSARQAARRAVLPRWAMVLKCQCSLRRTKHHCRFCLPKPGLQTVMVLGLSTNGARNQTSV